jgi:CRISPR-associated protein (Cas_Cas02710)
VDDKSRERFLKEARLTELPEVLGLRYARLLELILRGEVVEYDAVLRDLLQKRNHSILAHGLEPIGEEAASRFLGYADAMVNKSEVRSAAEHARLRGL